MGEKLYFLNTPPPPALPCWIRKSFILRGSSTEKIKVSIFVPGISRKMIVHAWGLSSFSSRRPIHFNKWEKFIGIIPFHCAFSTVRCLPSIPYSLCLFFTSWSLLSPDPAHGYGILYCIFCAPLLVIVLLLLSSVNNPRLL